MGFVMSVCVDADHAGDSITRRSRTGFTVFLNSSPIHWMSKKQASIESSTFGSEFTAMKQCTECLRGLRCKLRMMGAPVEGPACVLGDNQSVPANTTIPDSTLKKKSQSIACHFVREGVARDEWRTAHIDTHENPADSLTKPLPAGGKRKSFIEKVLHWIFEKEESEDACDVVTEPLTWFAIVMNFMFSNDPFHDKTHSVWLMNSQSCGFIHCCE